jgi:hypothetical protein
MTHAIDQHETLYTVSALQQDVSVHWWSNMVQSGEGKEEHTAREAALHRQHDAARIHSCATFDMLMDEVLKRVVRG